LATPAKPRVSSLGPKIFIDPSMYTRTMWRGDSRYMG